MALGFFLGRFLYHFSLSLHASVFSIHSEEGEGDDVGSTDY